MIATFLSTPYYQTVRDETGLPLQRHTPMYKHQKKFKPET
jgi:hypothetical protein